MTDLARFCSLLLWICCSSTPVLAATWTVRPDGSGDFPDVQAAVDAVVEGDVIELTDGTFTGPGNRDIDYAGKAITIRSQSGEPADCVIDCEGSAEEPHRGFHFHSGEQSGSILSGVTIRNGWSTTDLAGGAIRCQAASSPDIRGCIFSGNRYAAIRCETQSSPTITDCLFTQNLGQRGGGISCHESTAVVTGCQFVANVGEWSGGAFSGYASSAVLTDCRFEDNTASNGGAIAFIAGNMATITDCLFAQNTSVEFGGAIFLFCFIEGMIERCTLVGNTSFHGGGLYTGKMTIAHVAECTFWGNGATLGGGIATDGDRPVTIDRTIIAGSTTGAAIYCEYDVTLTCSDLYGNAAGDWVECVAGQLGVDGNMQADPLFCDAAAGDLTLDETSPCAPAGSGACGLIGAWPVGCGTVATTPTTWGSIKGSFR